jgi:adenine-specific DNA glycosylase
VEEGSSPEVVIYAARDLNPDYPGIFDVALWEIGRAVCRPTVPLCSECRLAGYCAYTAQRL